MPMRSIEQVLTEMPTFAGLEPEHLARIAGCGENRGFEAGEYLAREGDPADTFYAVRRGRAALEIHPPAGAPLVVETIGDGAVVGWSWLFPPYRWSFDVRALEPIRAVSFDGACLRGKCDADRDLGYALMQRFSGVILERLQATRLQLIDVYGKPAAG